MRSGSLGRIRVMKRRWVALAGLAGFSAFALGFHGYGVAASEAQLASDRLSVAYYAIQLLVLNGPSVPAPVPWTLHAGRFLGLLLFGYGVVRVVGRIFRLGLARVRWQFAGGRDHIVIAYSGEETPGFAEQAAARGNRVVILGGPEAGERLPRGVLAFPGDPADRELLERARVHRAASLICLGHDDGRNLAVIQGAARVVRGRRGRRPLAVRMLLKDADLRLWLERERAFARTREGVRVNLRDVHFLRLAVRRALNRHPLDFELMGPGVRRLRVVLVGADARVYEFALRAALMGHTRWSDGTPETGPHICFAGPRGSVQCAEFKARHPQAGHVARMEALDLEPLSSQSPPWSRLAAHLDGADPEDALTTVVFAGGTEGECRALFLGALDLWARLRRRCQVILMPGSRGDVTSVLSSQDPSLVPVGFHVVESEDSMRSWDVLIEESDDVLARGIHDAWLAALGPDERSGAPSWDDLEEELRESSRLSADFIPARLRTVGCALEGRRADQAQKVTFREGELDTLARMEHARWCAERRMAGWTWAEEGDHDRRRSPFLSPWERLTEQQRERSRNMAERIADTVGYAGLAVVRSPVIAGGGNVVG